MSGISQPEINTCGEPTREEHRARIQDTIASVDRWMDSDDWAPWSPPSDNELAEIKDKMKKDPDYMRPEIASNELRHKECLSSEIDKTTAHSEFDNYFR